MLNIPKTVQSLFVNDSDATRVRDNLTTAVQPLLDFTTSTFQTLVDNTLNILRPIQTIGAKVVGPLIVTGPTTLANGTAGDFKFNSISTVVPLPGAAPVPARTRVDMSLHWRQPSEGASVRRTIDVVLKADVQTPSYIVTNRYMPFSGTVVAMEVMLDRTITVPLGMQLYKNALTSTTGWVYEATAIPAGRQTPTGPITIPRGTVNFVAGDFFGVSFYVSITTTFVAQAAIWVEVNP